MERSHSVLLAFLDRDGDVAGFAVLPAHQWPRTRYAGAVDIDGFRFRVLHQNLEIAIVLIESPNADFEGCIQLVAVVGLGHDRERTQRTQRNTVWPGEPHGPDDPPGRKRGIPLKNDIAYLYLWALDHVEDERYSVSSR